MATDLLDELADAAADAARRKSAAVSRYSADAPAAVLTNLARTLEGVTVRVAEEASGIVSGVFWLINSGLNVGKAKDRLRKAIEVCETGIELTDAARLLAGAGLYVDDADLVAASNGLMSAVDSAAARLVADRNRVAGLLATLDRPRPEIDREKLADALRQTRESKGLTSDEMIAAIRSRRM
jgi:hypothetical protein